MNPNENFKIENPEYDECTKYALHLETELLEKLNEDEKAVYKKFMENHDSVRTMEVIQAFVNGYKIGSLMTMEVLINKESLYEWK